MDERSPGLPNSVPGGGEEISVFILAAALLRGRRLVWKLTLVGALGALVLALLKPRTYTTSFSFVPQAASESASSGLASLAGQFGVSIGAGGASAQSPQFYVDLIRTRSVLGPIARDSVSPAEGRRVPVSEFLGVRATDEALLLEKTLRVLRGSVISASAATRTTGVISVSVTTESPLASFEIAQRLLNGVNAFNLVTRQSQAKEERVFTEARLQEARSKLLDAEADLERFLKANRQFSNSPELALVRDRLERAVSLHQQVAVRLAQQLEEVRIREVRDIPVITVIEQPAIAAAPNARGRVRLLMLGVFLGGLVGILAVLLKSVVGLARAREPAPNVQALATEWRSLFRSS